jgi:phosphoglycerol transferase
VRTISPGSTAETTSAPDDVEVNAGAGVSRLERLGFPPGVRPVRETGLVAIVVAPILTIVYKLWGFHPKVPISYSGDGLSTSAYTKAIIENGWYFYNPRLAAPFTADWRDFPVGGENLHWIVLKIFGMVTGNYAISVNAYFLLGFFLVAFSAYFVARFLRFGIATSLVVGVVYAFLPFHAYRGEAHLARGVYYAVPPGVLLIFWLINYRTEFFRSNESKLVFRRGRMVFTLLVCVLMGSSDTQNAAFMVSIMGVLALVVAARDRDWRPLALLGVIGIATFGTLFANNLPFLYARHTRGANTTVANRPLSDQDRYALRPVDLVLPAPGHRIPAFAKLADKSAAGRRTNSETPGTPLGMIGTVGFVWSIGAVFALGVGSRVRSDSTKFVAQLGAINAVAILIGTIGGFAFLLALAGFGSYRTWNRISLFIAFASLLATAVLLDKLFNWLKARLSVRHVLWLSVVAIIVGVLTLGGALDQITPRYVPNYKATAARFDIDATFYHELEKSVPKSSMMFQLPFEPFPEAGTIANMTDYQDFTGYLHTKNLRWNYGGMNGRPEGDWQRNLSIYDPAATLASLATVGFQGVVVDRTGFSDNADSFLAAAKPFVGDPQLTSTDDRLLYLDLTGLRARLQREIGDNGVARSRDVTLGNTIKWDGFSFPEPLCGGTRRWSVSPSAWINLVNSTKQPQTITFSSDVRANPRATSLAITAPGIHDKAAFTNGVASINETITLPPGLSKIRLDLNGPQVVAPQDARTLYFALENFSFGPQYESPAIAWAHQLNPGCKSGASATGR